MGSSKAPAIVTPDPAASVVAAVAKDPGESSQNADEQESVRTRKRGIASTYNRYQAMSSAGTGSGKTTLGS